MEHFFQDIDGWSQMTDQGELLETVLVHFHPTEKIRVAEIGVYKGRMTAMWNVILRNRGFSYEYTAIDHFAGSPEHEKGVDYLGLTMQNLGALFKEGDCLRVIANNSLSEVVKYPDKYFDIVYIDATHEYEPVKADIAAWLPKVRPGGVLCGDDYVPGWPGVMQAVDEAFPSINRVGGQQWWVKK